MLQNALLLIAIVVLIVSFILSVLLTFLLTMLNIKQEDSEFMISRLLGFTVKSLQLQYILRIEQISLYKTLNFR